MKYLIGLLSIMLIACGSGSTTTSDDILTPVLKGLEQEGIYRLKSRIFLKNLKDTSTNSLCVKEDTSVKIFLNTETWAYISTTERELSLLRSMAECDFNKTDNLRLRDDGCPENIMYQPGVSISCYNKYRAEYIKAVK